MKFIFVLAAIGLAFLTARLRISSYNERFEKAHTMTALAEAVEKNYNEGMESVFEVCAVFFKSEKLQSTTALCDNIIERFGNADFAAYLSSLAEAHSEQISSIIINMKEISNSAEKKALSELESIKNSAYIFYIGMTMILALLII